MLISRTFNGKIHNVHTQGDGRVETLDVEENGQYVTTLGIYAPNQDSPTFFTGLETIMKERSENKIIIGDFNLTLNVDNDRCQTYHNNQKAKEKLEDIMDQFCLKDVWRCQHPTERQYSWFKRGDIQKASRIDFMLITAGLDQKAKNVEYIPGYQTDHRALYAVIDMMYTERGSGYWKFNNRLLQDQEYLKLINHEIDETMKNQKSTPLETWEWIKKRIKDKTVQYSKQKVSEDKLVIAQLTEKVNDLEIKFPLSEQEQMSLENSKIELEEKLRDEIKGVMFRSKVQWAEEGEKCTKYFFSLEKARYNAKTCYKLIDEEGNEILNTHKILDKQREFYTELYSADPDVHFDITNVYGVKVPTNIREDQEEILSEKDLKEALKGMKNNKTPGGDGLSVDFYKVFWGKLEFLFMQMVNYSYQNFTLHSTARKGILNLIPKANKDTRYIKNLRPITLLNTDYKIIEKAVANKMIPALKHIIHQDQRGFMKDRRISVNIRKMLDIMHYTEIENLEAVILSLDFVKCFDRCSFSILHGSLDFFEFGEVVRKWTQILYQDFSVQIQNNGYFSQGIDILKGVHQGGCCSSVYFLVIAEILALSLRSNQQIKSIVIKSITNLLNQFADDMDIFSLNDESSIRTILYELDKFHYHSGFKVSYDKTTLYRIGSLRHSNAQLYNIDQFNWSNEDITVLGITISHDDLVEKNYQDLVAKTRETLNSWQNRNLTLIGKVQVVNTLVASLFVYRMMVLPTIPRYLVKKIDNMIREFLWNGKKAKIAYTILQNPKDQGGLNLVNLTKKDAALKATWPQILYTEKEYAVLAYNLLRVSSLQEDIWRCTILSSDARKMKVKNSFWQDVLEGWSQYNFLQNPRTENQILWYNSYIRVNDKPFFWADVYSKGLRYVYQLFEEKQFISQEKAFTEFGLTNMRLNSIKSAIPREWKIFFCTYERATFFPLPPHNYDICLNTPKGFSRTVYHSLQEDVILVHNKYVKWIKDLGPDFCEDICHYGKLHQQINQLTNITKYRSFQYRILQRGIVTNIQLSRWNVITSELCTFCGEQRETILHLFCHCPIVFRLWSELREYIWQEYNTREIEITPTTIILNRIHKSRNHAINFICLVTKQYIYKTRCLQQEINFKALRSQIKSVETLEKYIAVKNMRLRVHEKKWSRAVNKEFENMEMDDYVISYEIETELRE